MKTITGVVTENDHYGILHKITIDVKEHPEAIIILKELGLISKTELQSIVAMNPEQFITIDEAKESITKYISKLYGKDLH